MRLKIYMCRYGHLKYSNDVPDICNICGNKEFTLQKGIQVIIGTGDGEYELSQKPEHDNSKK